LSSHIMTNKDDDDDDDNKRTLHCNGRLKIVDVIPGM